MKSCLDNYVGLKEEFISLMKSNQRKIDCFRYTIPSSSVYPFQWFWDSCFHAVIYTRLDDLKYAKDEIRSLLASQWENGMIPHIIYWENSTKFQVEWGTDKKTSSITQPPMIAYAVERIYEKSNDKTFVQEVFDKLDNYYKWLYKERSDDYLLSIIHPWESGKDDFVSWDNVLELEKPTKEELMKSKLFLIKEYVTSKCDSRKFMMKNIFNVKSLLFNSVYLRNLKSMYNLSTIVRKEEEYYKDMIIKVKNACDKWLYDRKSGLYLTRYNGNNYIKDYENISIFLPLFAGLLEHNQAQKLVEDYLLNKRKFWTDYPIPTISVDNDNFEPYRYWRGSTWININWFVYKGLIDYKFYDVAEELKKRSINLIKKSGFCEYFNSINGEGYGPHDFCWSGLIFDMD